MTELELARAIAAGEAPSPSRFGSFDLWAIRITGTGRAERTSLNETVWRDPGTWLSAETLARCNGLPVVLEHPRGSTLNGREFAARAVGSVLLPYVADTEGVRNDGDPDRLGPDVWAVVRIYDDALSEAMRQRPHSTSPAVAFKGSDGNETYHLPDGSQVLLEGTPSLIDHVALVSGNPGGVWDKGAGPSGVRNDLEDKLMADETPPVGEDVKTEVAPGPGDHDGEKLDKLLTHLDSVAKRLDGLDALAKRIEALEASQTARGGGTGDDDRSPTEIAHGEAKRVAADSFDHVARAEREREDAAARADAQARADAVYQALGERAPAPMAGEALLNYRRRLLRGVRRFGRDGLSKMDTDRMSGSDFDLIEAKLYADAVDASKSPEIIPGVLREVVKVDQAGRRVSTFYGDHTYIRHFKGPTRRVAGFNTRSHG